MKVLLFNGPPRSGKDTSSEIAIDLIANMGMFPASYKLAEPLKNATHAAFGLNVKHDHFESVKDTPLNEFYGKTPREAYISLSEDYLKEIYGKEFFGKSAVNYLKTLKNADTVVVSDCGFACEINPIVEHVGSHNVAIIHLVRAGTNFNRDSRGYVSIKNVPTYRILNNGTKEDLKNHLNELLQIIL